MTKGIMKSISTKNTKYTKCYQKNTPDLLLLKKISEQTNHSEKVSKRAILHFTTD